MSLAVDRIGQSWFASNATAVLQFSHLHEAGASLSAEVTATATLTGSQHWSRLNLAAPRSRSELARALDVACQGVTWGPLLDEACHRVVLALRAGNPPVALTAVQPSPSRWLVPDLIPHHETTVIYGDGGTMKSLVSLALAWSGLSGRSFHERLTISPLSSVLYLDWESRREEHEGRWWGLSAAVGIPGPDGLSYLAMDRPVVECLGQIEKGIGDTGAELVIVDSLAPACGAEPESSDAAVRTLTALRSLPATRLVVAHVSKAMADLSGPTRPFGSVFVRNLARSTVEAKLEDAPVELGQSIVTYHHTKSNTGRKRPPFALAWTFTDGGYIAVDKAEPDLSHAGIPAQILAFLRGGAQTGTTISKELGLNPESVRRTLNRLETGSHVSRIVPVSGGKGKETLWGLRDTYRDNGR